MAMSVAQKNYINWLAKKDPYLLAVSIKRATGKNVGKTQLGGLDGISDLWGAVKNINFTNLTKTIADTAAKLATTKAQVQIINAQTKRAIAGQPPIDTAPYQPTLTATFNPATVQGQMAVNTTAQQLNTQSKTGLDLMKLLPWVVLGVGGVIVLKKLKG